MSWRILVLRRIHLAGKPPDIEQVMMTGAA